MSNYFVDFSRGAPTMLGRAHGRAEGARRHSGCAEGEAAGRGRRGGGSASPAAKHEPQAHQRSCLGRGPAPARSCRVISLFLALGLCTVACGGSTFEGPTQDAGGGTAGQDGGAGTGGHATGGAGGAGASGGAGGAGASGGAAGGGASGGVAGGGASGGAGTGGSGGGTCPESPPATGSTCGPEGLRCTYPAECWSQNFVCQSGTWWQEPSPGPPQPTCEAFSGNPPADGESCKCLGWLDCTYELCDTARGRVHAVCAGSTWDVDETPCPDVTCGVDPGGGPATCEPGEICVRTFAGPGIQEACAPNPCAPSELDCWCAASACGGSPYVCSNAADGYVTCDCPVCA